MNMVSQSAEKITGWRWNERAGWMALGRQTVWPVRLRGGQVRFFE
jgi:hypothetical protein